MTDSHDLPGAACGDIQHLSGDPACILGALREIATVWQRPHPFRPEPLLNMPMRLEDATHELAASAEALAGSRSGQPPELAFSVAGQLPALRRDIGEAAVTSGAGITGLGDSRLRDSAGAAAHRAWLQVQLGYVPASDIPARPGKVSSVTS